MRSGQISITVFIPTSTIILRSFDVYNYFPKTTLITRYQFHINA